jgi:hypothetical protein
MKWMALLIAATTVLVGCNDSESKAARTTTTSVAVDASVAHASQDTLAKAGFPIVRAVVSGTAGTFAPERAPTPVTYTSCNVQVTEVLAGTQALGPLNVTCAAVGSGRDEYHGVGTTAPDPGSILTFALGPSSQQTFGTNYAVYPVSLSDRPAASSPNTWLSTIAINLDQYKAALG